MISKKKGTFLGLFGAPEGVCLIKMSLDSGKKFLNMIFESGLRQELFLHMVIKEAMDFLTHQLQHREVMSVVIYICIMDVFGQ